VSRDDAWKPESAPVDPGADSWAPPVTPSSGAFTIACGSCATGSGLFVALAPLVLGSGGSVVVVLGGAMVALGIVSVFRRFLRSELRKRAFVVAVRADKIDANGFNFVDRLQLHWRRLPGIDGFVTLSAGSNERAACAVWLPARSVAIAALQKAVPALHPDVSAERSNRRVEEFVASLDREVKCVLEVPDAAALKAVVAFDDGIRSASSGNDGSNESDSD
jgi:hypothetical protein